MSFSKIVGIVLGVLIALIGGMIASVLSDFIGFIIIVFGIGIVGATIYYSK